MKTLTPWTALRRIARIGQHYAEERPGLCPDLDVAEPRDREIGIDLGVDPYLARDEWRRFVAAVSNDDLARRAFEAGFERGIPDPPPCFEDHPPLAGDLVPWKQEPHKRSDHHFTLDVTRFCRECQDDETIEVEVGVDMWCEDPSPCHVGTSWFSVEKTTAFVFVSNDDGDFYAPFDLTHAEEERAGEIAVEMAESADREDA